MSNANGATRHRNLWIVLLTVGLLILPFVLKSHNVSEVNEILTFVIAIIGLNILTGYNGQISLGHGAFYAVGAYTTAILVSRYGVHYALTIPVAAVVCAAAGILVGFPALRLKGHYLALATYALALALPQLLKFKKIESWTGGVQGLLFDKPAAPFDWTVFGVPLDADRWLYFTNLAVAVIVLLLTRNLLNGRVGRALVAVRDHPIAASTMGINLPLYKTLTFGVSAAFTGVAGALGAMTTAFVAPDSFTAFLSISFLVGAVVGGIATIPGAVFGAIFIHLSPKLAADISVSASAVIYGTLLLVMVYLMPGGVAGTIQDAWRRRSTTHAAAPRVSGRLQPQRGGMEQ
ncbi:MAG: branched-chain amino acid ABC transporter permease [Pseudomonadota bacterium]